LSVQKKKAKEWSESLKTERRAKGKEAKSPKNDAKWSDILKNKIG
jgi:hypothetical protein